MSSTKKKIIFGIILILVLAGAAAFLLMPEKVTVDTVKKADVKQTVRVTGNIEADEIETLYAPVTGRIERVAIQPGDTVVALDVVASYDITLIENEYDKAKAALEANKQGYEAAVSENNKASAKFAAAQSAEVSSRAELETAMGLINALNIANRGSYLEPADYNRALELESSLKNLEQNIEINLSEKAAAEGRLEGIKSSKIAYQEVYDSAKAQMESAKAALEAALEAALPEEEIAALQEAYNVAEAAYSDAENRYEKIKDQIDDAEDDVDDADEALEKNSASFSSALSQLDEINKRNYSKTMSDEEFAQYTALESRIALLQQDLSKSISDRQFNESKLLNPHTIMQYESTVDVSEADVTNADYTLNLARAGVVADKSGVILEKFVDSNAMVEAGTPICTIQPTENIKVEAMISKFDIDKIAIKQEADIVVGESRFKGFVSKIFPVANKDESGKPKVKVWIEMDVSDSIPTIGLEAQVTIHTGEAIDVLSVPFESVYSDDEGDYVYVLNGTNPEKRYVEIGIKGNDNYSITDGLKEDETVILTPFSDEQLNGRYMKE